MYDAGMDVLGSGTTYPAEVEVPAGGYVCLFAPAGTSAAVTPRAERARRRGAGCADDRAGHPRSACPRWTTRL